MSLHTDHMNLIKSLKSLHGLWIFTSVSWALPDLRVGTSNSHFCRCGSNLWLASTSSIWVSKLQPKQCHCCFRLTLPRAVCVMPGHCLFLLPVPMDDLSRRRHQSWPARLYVLMRGRIASPPPQHAWNQQCHPQNTHPRQSLEMEREKEEEKTLKWQTTKPQPQLQT